MLMKNFKINSGKSGKPGDPISYVLSDYDHTGKQRSVKPEILAGDEFALRTSIENNHRKCKYTSGVLAFADKENPTPEQINIAVDRFLDTFLPGKAKEHVPHFLVAHRDKGNLEIHFVVAREWTKEDGTTKSFNMDPPGKGNMQFKDDFVATINHELGFNQINPNPFSVALSQFDRLDKKESKDRLVIKSRIKNGVKDLILNGTINNREQLVDFLKENGTVTRTGKDYISFKSPSMKKPIRFKGPVFEEETNYADLKQQYVDYKNGKVEGVKLTDVQYQEIQARLQVGIKNREDFNNRNFAIQPKKSRTRAHLYTTGADGKKTIQKANPKPSPMAQKGTSKPLEPVSQVSTLPKPIEESTKAISEVVAVRNDDINIKKSVQPDKSSSPVLSGGSSGNDSIGISIGKLAEVRHKIGFENDPGKRAILEVQAKMLEQKIAYAREAERIRKVKESEKLSVHRKFGKN